MKKLLTPAFPFVLLLFFFASCRNEETPTPTSSVKNRVEKVVFTDVNIDAITTIHFQYGQSAVESVRWNFYVASGGINRFYSEDRFYSTRGELDSLHGIWFNGEPWKLSYEYKNRLRYKIISKKNGVITTTTFTEVKDTKPTQVENLFGVYGVYDAFAYPKNSTLQFDARGNLVSQKHTGIPGYPSIVHEKVTTYNTELNPLLNLIETPLPQLFEFYDDFGFYYSPNLPASTEANYPFADPRHNRIKFEYQKDFYGRIIRINGLNPDDGLSRYVLEITYHEN